LNLFLLFLEVLHLKKALVTEGADSVIQAAQTHADIVCQLAMVKV
jgi:hypothetical protein